MSTNSECCIVKIETGKWFYILEGNDRNLWDWREGAFVYGPFTNAKAATTHLFQNHANPGGYYDEPDGNTATDDVLKDCVNRATKPGGEWLRWAR